MGASRTLNPSPPGDTSVALRILCDLTVGPIVLYLGVDVVLTYVDLGRDVGEPKTSSFAPPGLIEYVESLEMFISDLERFEATRLLLLLSFSTVGDLGPRSGLSTVEMGSSVRLFLLFDFFGSMP